MQVEVGEVDRGQVVGSLDPSCQSRLLIWQVKNTQLHWLNKKGTIALSACTVWVDLWAVTRLGLKQCGQYTVSLHAYFLK